MKFSTSDRVYATGKYRDILQQHIYVLHAGLNVMDAGAAYTPPPSYMSGIGPWPIRRVSVLLGFVPGLWNEKLYCNEVTTHAFECYVAPRITVHFRNYCPGRCYWMLQIRGAPERALMARRFRKEFIELFIQTTISNAEVRVKKVRASKKRQKRAADRF